MSFPSNFGFQIRSSQRLKFLRTGASHNGVLNIETMQGTPSAPRNPPLLDWKLNGSNQEVRANLYSTDHYFRFWISDTGWYDIDPVAGLVRVPDNDDEILREHRLWGLPSLLCALHRGDFSLHAAAVEVDNGAVLLAAPGRHGKTTLALAFHRYGYRVLSEDSACCRLRSAPLLLPGPAMLRVRPDIFDGSAPAGTHVVSVKHDRIYLGVDENQRGTDEPVPIRAVIFLRESSSEIHFEPVSYQNALPNLWALNFHLPNDNARAQVFRQLSTLVKSVPIWDLYRPLRITMLNKTVEKIAKRMRSVSV